MGIKALLDTNAVIYLQKGLLSRPLIPGDYAISVITEIELLSFHGLDAMQQQWLQRFINAIFVHDITPEIKQLTISLRKQQRIKLPDAVIAATAIETGRTLISLDKQFTRIDDLSVEAVALRTN